MGGGVQVEVDKIQYEMRDDIQTCNIQLLVGLESMIYDWFGGPRWRKEINGCLGNPLGNETAIPFLLLQLGPPSISASGLFCLQVRFCLHDALS